MSTPEETKNMFLLMGLLEKYGPENTPNQARLYHALYPNHQDDSDARKRMSQIIDSFQARFDKTQDRFYLKQTSRGKYYLELDEEDPEEGRERLLQAIIHGLTIPRVLLKGVSRGSQALFYRGMNDYLDNAWIEARTALFCEVCLAIEQDGILEMECTPSSLEMPPTTTDTRRNEFYDTLRQGYIVFQPLSLTLFDPFLVHGHVQLSHTSLELTLPLRDIRDADLVLFDFNNREIRF